jgi:hypothetical protein
MATWIDSYPARELFLTQIQIYLAGAALGHLWYNSGTKFVDPPNAASSGTPICQDAQDSNLPMDSCHWVPTHLTSSRVRTHTDRVPRLSWATRLCGRNELSNQLSVKHAFNITWGHIANRSLTNIHGDRSTPKTSLPCCFTIDTPPGLHSIINTWLFLG